jgi:hypothetical protein
MNRRILLTCSVLLIVVCLVVSILGIFGAGFLAWKSEPLTKESQILVTLTPFPQKTETQEEKEENPEPEVETVTPEVDLTTPEAIDPAIIAEMELIQRQVIQDRGLEASGVFTRVLFTKDQLRQRVLDDFLKDYTIDEAGEDAIVLHAFGLLDAGFDMYNFYRDLLSEQIAGFYDNETKEMVVVQDTKFGGSERLTYAHEYTHALQDQNFDIRNGLNYNDDACENESERCAAIQALLEGDASLSEYNWFANHATTQDRTDIFAFFDEYESPVLDAAPEFIAKDFLFPYENGLEFVQYLYDQGGWHAVDQAYADLPVSTEQIMHPERYPDDKPILVSLPDFSEILGGGWTELDRGEMGEWYTFLILADGFDKDALINEEQASAAAEGWGGDSYIVYHNPDSDATVMVFKTLWESSNDASEFANTFKTYAIDRFGKPENDTQVFVAWNTDSEVHTLHVDGNTTTWILAPTSDLASTIWDAIIDQENN